MTLFTNIAGLNLALTPALSVSSLNLATLQMLGLLEEKNFHHLEGFELLVERNQGGQSQAAFLHWEEKDGRVGRPSQTGPFLEKPSGHWLQFLLQP